MLRLGGFVTAAIALGVSVQAQELELDLSFDDTAFFEDAQGGDSSAGPDIKATLRYGVTKSLGLTTTSSSLRFELSDRYDLGALGFLDWSGHFVLDDLAGGSVGRAALDNISLQNSAGNFSWKVGKFPIGWGEIEGVPVLDVLNAGLSLATLGTATSDLPGQWFASVDYFAGKATISGFVGLDPEIAHAAPAAGPDTDMEFGLRAQLPINQGQISLYGARLVPQAGVIDLLTLTSSARPYTLIGVSAHRASDAVLIEFDLAAKLGLERAGVTGLSSQTRIDASLGLEYAASATTQITASISAQHWLTQDGVFFDFGPGGPLPASQTTANYLLGATTGLAGTDLGLSLFLGGGLDGDTRFAAVNADFPVSDALSLSASFSRLWAAPGSLLGLLDGTQSLTFAAEFFF